LTNLIHYSNVLYNGIVPITLPLLRRGVGSVSEVGRAVVHSSGVITTLPHSIIRGDNK
jgi:hypothetical protein